MASELDYLDELVSDYFRKKFQNTFTDSKLYINKQHVFIDSEDSAGENFNEYFSSKIANDVLKIDETDNFAVEDPVVGDLVSNYSDILQSILPASLNDSELMNLLSRAKTAVAPGNMVYRRAYTAGSEGDNEVKMGSYFVSTFEPDNWEHAIWARYDNVITTDNKNVGTVKPMLNWKVLNRSQLELLNKNVGLDLSKAREDDADKKNDIGKKEKLMSPKKANVTIIKNSSFDLLKANKLNVFMKTISGKDNLILKNNVEKASFKEKVTSSKITIGFEYLFVKITRDWLVSKLLNSDLQWYNAYKRKGSRTDVPLMASSVVLIRNLEITANFSEEEKRTAPNITGLGSLAARYDGASKLVGEGIQIFGWMIRKNLPLPPIDDPILTKIAIQKGDTGPAVLEFKKQFNEYSQLPAIFESETFEAIDEYALKVYQQTQNMPVSGKLTYDKLEKFRIDMRAFAELKQEKQF